MKQKKYSTEEIIRLMRAHDASGQTKEHFCRENGIGLSTMTRWRKKMSGEKECMQKHVWNEMPSRMCFQKSGEGSE